MAVPFARPSRRAAGHLVLLVGSVGLLAYQLRGVDLAARFAHVQLGWVAAAVAALLVALCAAAHNTSAFAALHLRALDSLRAQLAIGGLRIVAPSAVSTPAAPAS
ncbi:MAG: hypothetical protein ACRDVG_16280 [Jatrophihabitantaceae bacterium]